MSIASEITALQTNLQSAKDAVVAKGGTVGNTGLAGLTSEIATIPAGQPEYVAPYANIEYEYFYMKWTISGYGYDGTCYGEITDDTQFETFLSDYNVDTSQQIDLSWQSISQGGDELWHLSYTDEFGQNETTFNDETALFSDTGIQVTWTLPEGDTKYEASFQISKEFMSNSMLGGIKYVNTDKDFQKMAPEYSYEWNQDCILGIPTQCIHRVVIGASATSFPDNFLYSCSHLTHFDMTKATSVGTFGKNFLYNCGASVGGVHEYKIIIPSGVTTIPDGFMKNTAQGATDGLVIPNTVTTIGKDFLSGDIYFNQSFTIPASVSSVGTNFLYNCRNYISTITVLTNSSPTDNNSLATTSSSYPMYATGVTIVGSGRSAWLTALPNSASNPYRKLIDGDV